MDAFKKGLNAKVKLTFLQCERERNDADDKCVALQRLVDSLERQSRELNALLSRSEDDVMQEKATATQMRCDISLSVFSMLIYEQNFVFLRVFSVQTSCGTS